MSIGPEITLLSLALMVGGAVFCVGQAAAHFMRRRDPAWQRVQALVLENDPGGAAEPGRGLREAIFGLLSRLARPAKPQNSWEMSKLRKDLLRAGYYSPNSVNVYLGIKVACCLILPGVLILIPHVNTLPVTFMLPALVGGACAGFLIPGFVLEAITQRRREKLTRELPEVMDLLVIAVEAGLGLDAAIRRVALEITASCPILAAEFKLVSLEFKAGVPRDRALKNLADRANVDEVAGLVSMLNQADRFGVSVGRSLRVHSDTVRTKWRQKMEEKAVKIPLKLLFPVLFMIFPAILVVMAGPAIIRVSETILK